MTNTRRLATVLTVTAMVSGGCTARSTAPSGDSPRPGAPVSPFGKQRQRDRAVRPPIERPGRQARNTAAPAPAGAAPSPSLVYYGGPILQSVEVYAVYWGPNVVAETQAALPGYLGALVGDGPFMQMLSEYDTTSPAQTIGHGVFKGAIVDADAPIPAGGEPLDDVRIQAELARLIDSGQVPATDNQKTLLMVYFPPGVTISSGGDLSCDAFCAYHGTFQRNGNDPSNAAYNVYYGVMPDFSTGPCAIPPGQTDGGCGFNSTNLANLLSVSSHEVIEAVTDADTLSDSLGPPMAWMSQLGGEIGDLCEGFPDGKLGASANVQLMWSNEDRGCRDHRPSSNVVIDVTPDSGSTAAGSTSTFTVTASAPGNGKATDTGDVTLAASPQLYGNVTATFTPPTIKAGGTSKLTLSIGADVFSQSAALVVSGKDGNGEIHWVQPSLAVSTAAPTVTVTPATGGAGGGDTVMLSGANLSPFATVSIGAGATVEPAMVQATADANGAVALQVTTPGYPLGGAATLPVKITVTNPDGHTGSAAFTYTAAAAADAPAVASIDVPSGPIGGGTIVGVHGTHFGPTAAASDGTIAQPKVTFGGVAATVVGYDGTANPPVLLVATPAASAAGTVDVVVTNADGVASAPLHGFKYGPNPPPTLDAAPVSVASGPPSGGTYVTIFAGPTSAPFDPTATVTFGGTAATVKTANEAFLGVITPAHAPGAVDIVIANADGQTATAAGAFTYAAAPAPPAPDMGMPAPGGNGGGGNGGGGNGGGGNGGGGNGGHSPMPNGGSPSSHSGCAMTGAPSSAAGSLILSIALVVGLALRRRSCRGR